MQAALPALFVGAAYLLARPEPLPKAALAQQDALDEVDAFIKEQQEQWRKENPDKPDPKPIVQEDPEIHPAPSPVGRNEHPTEVLDCEVSITKNFTNWAGNIKKRHDRQFKPKTKNDLEAIIKAAFEFNNPDVVASRPVKLHDHGKTDKPVKPLQPVHVRCGGCCHSWNDIFVGENDYFVDLKEYELKNPKRIFIEENGVTSELKQKNGPRAVTLMPNVTTGELTAFFNNKNLCILSDVILETVTYGGVVATGCHGTGKDQQTVCDYVIAMTILECDNKGNITEKTYRDKKYFPDSDTSDLLMSAVRCNLGLFGIITSITFKAEPMKMVRVIDIKPKVKDFFPTDVSKSNDTLKDLVLKNYAVEVFWFPFSGYFKSVKNLSYNDKWDPFEDDTLWVKIFSEDHKDKKYEPPSSAVLPVMNVFKQIHDKLQTNVGFFITDKLGINSNICPLLLHIGAKTLVTSESVKRMTDAIHYLLFIDDFPVRDLEFIFEVLPDFSNIKTLFAKTMKYIQEKQKLGQYPLNVALEARFIRASDCFMSPAYSADKTKLFCYIEVLSTVSHAGDWELFCADIFKMWRTVDGFIGPHWAKEMPNQGKEPRTNLKLQKEVVQGMLKKNSGDLDRLGTFQKMCKERDPTRLFTNSWLANTLDLK